MISVSVRNLAKNFGRVKALDDVSLEIGRGELFFLLGPSGCGKTTLLRSIAGFYEPDAGRILFGDRDVTDTPPQRRNTGMVFQNYALWPHMTVEQNVAFGLRVRKVGRDERNRRVAEALATVRMSEYARRKPNQLSGGQQQRVALARALVIRPQCLLLDEPLSNLDAKLRLEMRGEIRHLCKEAGLTGIYVTHDQKEALSVADRMAVMFDGRIGQVGTPEELYRRPADTHIADFLGETNFLAATVRAVERGRTGAGADSGPPGDELVLDTPIGVLRAAAVQPGIALGTNCTLSIRPEAIVAGALSNPHANRIQAQIGARTYLGEVVQIELRIGEVRLRANVPERGGGEALVPGTSTDFHVDQADVVVLNR